MAILNPQRGPNISIEILGYQFPDATDIYDGNWLNIKLSVNRKRGSSWSGIDPALETFNVEQICIWLMQIASSVKTDRRLWFTEPYFAMNHSGKGKLIKELSFLLCGKFAPGYPPIKPLRLRVGATPEQLALFACQLEKEASHFPVRFTKNTVEEKPRVLFEELMSGLWQIKFHREGKLKLKSTKIEKE